MKRSLPFLALIAIAALAINGTSGCSDQPTTSNPSTTSLLKPTLSTPTLSVVSSTEHTITVRVTAGSTGAPAGFSIQWERSDDYATYGWASGQYSYCSASFSGNASGSQYALGANQSVDVVIGVDEYTGAGESGGCGELECGTQYAIRGFAHANNSSNRSAFTSTVFGATDDCPVVDCVKGFGHWKNNTSSWPSGHSPSDAWFGSSTETWISMLNKPVAGDKGVQLAHTYIDTKLNICNGSNPNAAIISALSDAYDYFSGTLSLTNSQLQSLHNTLISEQHNMTCDGDGTYCP